MDDAPAELEELAEARQCRNGDKSRAGADTALADDLLLGGRAVSERVGKAMEELGRGD